MAAIEAVEGKSILVLIRKLGDTTAALQPMLQTKFENKIKSDTDSEPTKSGMVVKPGAPELDMSMELILAKGDKSIKIMNDSALHGDKLEIWIPNLQEPGTGGNKFHGTYYQGRVKDWELQADAKDLAQYKCGWAIDGVGAKGEITVTPEQQDLAQYEFVDTIAKG